MNELDQMTPDEKRALARLLLDQAAAAEEQAEPEQVWPERHCLSCDAVMPLYGLRANRTTCSDVCRMRLSRQRRREVVMV